MSETGQQTPGTRRGHRHGKTRMLVAAGAVAAAAAAAVTTALLAGTGDAPASASSAPPSALAALTGALAQTSQDSYSFNLDSTVMLRGREMNADTVSGTIDPAHEQGTELMTARVIFSPKASLSAQIRFIGTYVYTKLSPGSGMESLGKPWDKAPAPPQETDVLPASELYGFVSDQPVSPDELRVVLLRFLATVRDAGPASGPGWTGTRYAFTARLSTRSSLSGTAYVDTRGRVRRLVTTTTQASGITKLRNLTFGDYGAPGPVTAPPASQVKFTSTPWWGFYF